MIEHLFHSKKEPLVYLDRIDELDQLQIVRLKGDIDQTVIPIIEKRIDDNRRAGDTIKKNVLLDFAKVNKVDSATIAFHLIRLKEYQLDNRTIAFINVPDQMTGLLEMFKQDKTFRVFRSEQDAVRELNT